MKRNFLIFFILSLLSIAPVFSVTIGEQDNVSLGVKTEYVSNASLNNTQDDPNKGKIIIQLLKAGWKIISGLELVQWCYDNLPKSWKNWFEGTVNWAHSNYVKAQNWLEKNRRHAWNPTNFIIII